MKYLRIIANVTLIDNIPNAERRNRLQVQSLDKYIQKAQLGWNCMDEEKQVEKGWLARKLGRRRRPRRSWEEQIAEFLNIFWQFRQYFHFIDAWPNCIVDKISTLTEDLYTHFWIMI